MKGLFTLGALLLAVGTPAAAELEDIHQQFAAAQVKELDFGAISCKAEITAGKSESVAVEILGSDKEMYSWDIGLNGARLEVKQKNRRISSGSNRQCRAAVKLPSGLLMRAESVSGSLIISGGFKSVDVHSTSGLVKLAVTGGDAKVDTVSASATLQELTGGLYFKSVSGGLDAQWSTIPARAEVRIKTVSGDTVLRLPAGRSIKVALKSISGDLHNDLPTDPAAGFVVKAETVSGSLAVLKAKPRP